MEYTDSERKLLRDCLQYSYDPSGLPGHALMVLISKMYYDLLSRMGIVIEPFPYPAGGDDA